MNFIHRKRKHHRRRKSEGGRKIITEAFITSYLFKLLGVIVLLIGLFYAYNLTDAMYGVSDFILQFLKPNNKPDHVIISTEFKDLIIFYFLPGILTMILAGLLVKKLENLKYILSLLAIFYFIAIQCKILIFNTIYGGAIFPDIFIALIFLIITIIGPLIIAFQINKSFILTITNFYFYLSLILISIIYGVQSNFLFPVSMIFTLSIVWLARKINKPYVNIINFVLAIDYLGLFWFRKLVVNSRPEFLFPFFTYGTLFIILYYGVVIYSSSAKQNPMPKWMQMTMGFTNFIFYAGTTAFVITKYYSFEYLWVFALGLLLYNLLGLYLSGKYFPAVWKLPLHIITILLAALMLPLLLNQSTILIFTAGLSLLLLFYSKYSKNQPSIIVSMISMGVMSLDFFFHWIFKYLPALLISNSILTNTLIRHGILNGVIVMATLALSIPLIKDLDITLSKKVFSKIRYSRLIKGLTLISLFLTFGWIFSSLVILFFESSQLIAPGWFISGSIYFILLIILHPQQFSSFKKPILFLSLIFILSYSILVHLNFLESINDLMLSSNIYSGNVVLHYISLGLLITLTAMSLIRLLKLYPINKTMRRGLQLYGFLIIILILFTEYDNVSILFRIKQFILNPSLGRGQEILDFNHRLPFSLILIGSSISVLVWSLFKRHYFLRNTSILLFIIGIVKIFLYDFTILSEVIRTILFFFIGLLLLSFSFFYTKLKKAANTARTRHRTRHHRPTPVGQANTTDGDGESAISDKR